MAPEMNFLQYDYVGPTWLIGCTVCENGQKTNIKMGNGGFSIRTVESMKEICRRYDPTKIEPGDGVKLNMTRRNLSKIPEDIYFSYYIKKLPGAKIPSSEMAKKFAMETEYSPEAFGGHQYWTSFFQPNACNLYGGKPFNWIRFFNQKVFK